MPRSIDAYDAVDLEHRHLRELANAVQEVFWLANASNTELLYVSPAYERIFGRSRAALRVDVYDWIKALHPEDRDRMTAFAATVPDCARHAEFRILRSSGEIRYIELKVFPVVEAGAVVRVAGVTSDVTERRQLEDQVRETQKLESLGLLAGGIAHDFNNLLAVIAANASFLEVTVAQDDPNRDVLGDIAYAVDRGAALTRQLLAFSRKQDISPVILDLNAAVTEASKMLVRMVGERVVVKTELTAGLGHVKIDPGCLVQVLMNLVVNARDAMPGGGGLSISTGLGGPREVMLSVTDTGCGMTPEIKARAFEPLFTTKGPGRGTGLGLAVVHGIVTQAGGRLEIESAQGCGTSVRIFLEAYPAELAPGAGRAASRAGRGERLILVEDDADVRRSVSRALRIRGYDVLEAKDGTAALALLGAHGKRIDLLVTDVGMPGMNGCELVDTARRLRPTLRVLYISGHTEDERARQGIDALDASVLEKPFPGDALAARVRQILDDAKLRTPVAP